MKARLVIGDYEIVPVRIQGFDKPLLRYEVRYKSTLLKDWLTLRQAKSFVAQHRAQHDMGRPQRD